MPGQNLHLAGTLKAKERMFYQPVFQGMEADDDRSAFRRKHLRESAEKILQIFQLAVDGQTQRHKSARCRMKVVEARPGGDSSHYHLRQFGG